MSITLSLSSRRMCLLLLLVGSLVCTLASGSSATKIKRQVLDAGGTVWSSTTSYRLCSALGQPITGIQSGTSMEGTAGFWNKEVSVVVDVEIQEDSDGLPKEFALHQNYPNPFNPTTVIEYALPKASHVRITIYNLLGQQVKLLVAQDQPAGYKTVLWDGRTDSKAEVSSGVYFYRIMAGDFVNCKKMLLLK